MKTIKFKDLNNENKEISVEELIHSKLLFMKDKDKVIVITKDNKHYEMNALTFMYVTSECKKLIREESGECNGAREEEIEHYIN